jgi:arsenate reductase
MSDAAPAACGSAPVELIYQPGCSKSRAAFDLLAANGVAFAARDYLQAPLDATELRALLASLQLPVSALVRRDETAGLPLPAEHDEEAWIALLAEHPRLLQRPILRCGARALIARPPERVLEWVRPSA